MSAVVEKVLWPSQICICFIGMPLLSRRLAHVCPYGIIGLFNIQALAILAIQGFFELLVSLKTLQIGGTSNTKITRLRL